MSFDLIFEIVDGNIESTRLACLFLDLFLKSISLEGGSSELASLLLELALVLHTFLDDLAQLILVAVLEFIDGNPGLVFNLLSSHLILIFELFDFALLILVLLLLLKFLKLVLLVHLCLVRVLGQEKFLDVSFEIKLLLFLRLEQQSFALLIVAHLFHVLLLLQAKLFLVDLFEVVLLLISLLLNLLLLVGQLLSSVLKMHLLLLNGPLQLGDLIIIPLHRVFELLLTSLFLQLNVGLESLDARLDQIEGALFDQDLTVQDFSLRQFGTAKHAETAEGAVDAHREQLAVVVVQSHPLNLRRVSLHLEHLLHVLFSVTENLN